MTRLRLAEFVSVSFQLAVEMKLLMRDYSRQSLMLIQSTVLNYVEQFSKLPESRTSNTITFLKASDKFFY